MNRTSIGEQQPAPRTLTLTSQPASGGRGSGDSPGDHDDLKIEIQMPNSIHSELVSGLRRLGLGIL